MMIVRFRSKGDHEELLKKIKRMKKFTEELEDCLEEAYDEDYDYRETMRGSFRHSEYEDDEEPKGSRYSYRRGRMY